ncbi:prolyl aminopeptidase [Naasia sp. SYSU D00057]|uniref:prolyl aminopeptidase n=1 Tax=Naasia sp. SYSU D00057 TaxID=2817380 RepID=UPI0027DBFAFE|nr:prolyl aminopeptidase [Naasia sp. SYSU D00057]
MHPETEPHASGFLSPGDGQRIYWEMCGAPDGIPALVVHGGPGSGAAAGWRRFFDPSRYRVVLVDQRGCGRSTPSARDPGTDLSVNTTDALIRDFELLREALGIDRWLLLGASWGTTLALAYAQAHPDRVTRLVLFSVTTTTPREVEWITRDLGRVFPAEWDAFVGHLPEGERDGSIPAAYARLLSDTDPGVRGAAASAWCRWEDTHVSLAPGWRPDPRYADPMFRLTFARLVTHYWAHAAWRRQDELLDGVELLGHVPATLLHGRHDLSSPLEIPFRLHQRWPGSELHVPDAGHGVGLGESVRQVLDDVAR